MGASNTVQACLNGLSKYLCTAIPDFNVRTEWPGPNQQLKFPSVTLFSGEPKIMNKPPERMAVTVPDVNNKVLVTEVIGEVDFTLQMDLWASNKPERDKYLTALEGAINASVGKFNARGTQAGAGLNLQLTDYFNDWVRFDLAGSRYMDDEAAAQRGERRVKIDLLVNARIIQQRTYYAMVNIETHVTATTDPAEMADSDTFTDVRIVGELD